MEPTVFRFVGGTVQNAADAFLAPVLGLVVTTISGAVGAGVVLYVLGYVERPIGAFTAKSLRIIIVSGVALSVDVYGSAVASGIEGLEAMLAAALNVSGTTATNIYQVLDQSFGAGLDLTARCFVAADNASWRAFGSIIGWIGAGLIFVLRRAGFPMPPLVIGTVLGPTFEISLRQGLILTDGSFAAFFTGHPIALVLAVAALLMLPLPLVRLVRARRVVA